MTTGTVLYRRILVDLVLGGPTGKEVEVEFVLDTGFTGVSTMQPSVCEALGLRYVRPQPASLAEGSSVILEVYQATLFWSDVRFQGREGGLVSIEPL